MAKPLRLSQSFQPNNTCRCVRAAAKKCEISGARQVPEVTKWCVSRNLHTKHNVPTVHDLSRRTDMIVEYIRYKLPAVTCSAFESDYARAASSLAASAFCLGYELSR